MNASRKATIEQLERLLASSYTLNLKTQNYHWNVTGPMFTSLHQLFENQYAELAPAIDEIAERIRALGARSPGSYREFSELSEVGEAEGEPDARAMVTALLGDQQTLAGIAGDLAGAAEAGGDIVTADLATRRREAHEKNSWMLRSHLE